MIGQLLDHVVGVEERLFDQRPHVAVVRQVEDAVPFTAGPDQPGQAELGQMLGHRRRLGTDLVGQPIHGVLAVEEQPQDAHPRAIGQKLERVNGQLHLGVRRQLSNYLRIHADTLAAKFPPTGPAMSLALGSGAVGPERLDDEALSS